MFLKCDFTTLELSIILKFPLNKINFTVELQMILTSNLDKKKMEIRMDDTIMEIHDIIFESTDWELFGGQTQAEYSAIHSVLC